MDWIEDFGLEIAGLLLSSPSGTLFQQWDRPRAISFEPSHPQSHAQLPSRQRVSRQILPPDYMYFSEIETFP